MTIAPSLFRRGRTRPRIIGAIGVLGIVGLVVAGCGDSPEPPSPRCGDGVVDPGEFCDDGNLLPGDGCNPLCLPESLPEDEVCDDGRDNDRDGATDCEDRDCDDECPPPGADEELCDDGEDNDGDGDIDCDDADCSTAARCQPEICDDRRDNDGDGDVDCADADCLSSAACAPSDTCGDGIVDDGEECDDGDANSDDTPNACRTSCVRASCGDGVIDRLEACDEGDANSDETPDACRTTCRVATCGDGVTDAGEACDGGPACTDDCIARPFDECPGADNLWVNEQLGLASGVPVTGRDVLVTFADAEDDLAASEICVPLGGTTPSSDRVVVFDVPTAGVYRFTPLVSDGPWGFGRLARCVDEVTQCSGSAAEAGAPIEASLGAGERIWFVVEAGGATSARFRIDSWPSYATVGAACGDGAGACGPGLFCDGDDTCAAETEACETIASLDALDPALVGEGVVRRVSTIGGDTTHETAVCEDTGPSTSLTFRAATHGILAVRANTDASVAAHDGCGDEGALLGCAAGEPLELEVERGQRVTLVVDDVTERAQEHDVTFTFVPLLAAGQPCGDGPGRCIDGSFCDELVGRCRAEVGRTCEAPFEIGTRVVADPFGVEGASFLLYPGGRSDDEDPSCGVDTSDIYARWEAPRRARVTVEVDPDATVTAGAACGRSDACGEGLVRLDVDEGEELWLVVDSDAEVVNTRMTARDLVGAGAPCGADETGPLCDDPLQCGRNDLGARCVDDLAGTCESTSRLINLVDASSEAFTIDPGTPVWVGSCGVESGETARVVASAAGGIVIESTGGGFFVRRSCERPSSEASCIPDDALTRRAVVRVAAGEELVVFGQFDVLTSLSARAISSRSLGESCDPLGRDDLCEDALFCIESRCERGGAPIGSPCVTDSCDGTSFCAAGRCRAVLLAEGSACLPERTDSICELDLVCAPAAVDGAYACATTDGEVGSPCGVSTENGCREGLACDVEPGLGYGVCVPPASLGDVCRSETCEVGAWCALDGATGICAPQSEPDAACVPGACSEGFACIDGRCQIELPGRACGLDAWGSACPPHLVCMGADGAFTCSIE